MHRSLRASALVLTLAALPGCPGGETFTTDSGPLPDAAPLGDGGLRDAGSGDAGHDAAPTDGGPIDAGATDAGATDAGTIDAGPTDAGPTDAGPRCGDGALDPGEACDDAGTSDGDGCSAGCTIESGWTCDGAPSTCMSTCGDGVLASDETCDDGNVATETACVYGNATCTACDATCAMALSLTGPSCGDGTVSDGETCDDGNATPRDTCSTRCVPSLQVVDGSSNGTTGPGSQSPDARWVVVQSDATNLAGTDTNGQTDIYLNDRTLGTWTRISLAADGVTQPNGRSQNATVSSDGAFVVFQSQASNLVPGDTDTQNDIYLWERSTGVVRCITEATGATNFADVPYLSTDGSTVVFRTDAVAITGTTSRQVVAYDVASGTYDVVSRASGATGALSNVQSAMPWASADGRYVVFESNSTTLAADDTNGVYDIYLRDRVAQTTTRVSVASDGSQANGQSTRPVISADGRFVAFYSDASNFASDDTNAVGDLYARDLTTGETRRITVREDGSQITTSTTFDWRGGIATTGRTVFHTQQALMSVDTDATWDVYAYDWASSSLILVSLDENAAFTGGNQLSCAISPDGRWVTFGSSNRLVSTATSSTHTYLRDMD